MRNNNLRRKLCHHNLTFLTISKNKIYDTDQNLSQQSSSDEKLLTLSFSLNYVAIH